MSSSGRGRGYTGRHHNRPRPGDRSEDDAVRTLAELSPRATDRERHIMEPDREKTCENKERERDNETADLLDNISSEDDAVLKELLRIDEQFQPLLELLEQFSPSEDGIQFNRKLRHFETTISNMCPDENRLQAAFASFRAAALRNPVTARRLAGVGASFTRQQRQQLLRTTLLNVIMQGTFSKLDILERANPLFLINAANLMGDYFSEARLCNGNKVHILASPLLQYMKALLASDDVRAHRSLATQLMQNGRELLAVQQTETEELTIKIRIRLLTPPPCGIVWLLLSSDMALNKFLPLPNCLQQFYASNLKLTADTDYCEVSYGSWKKEETSDESGQSLNLSNSLDDENKPKLRPILGAGAALLRQGQQDVEWTPKSLTKRYDLNSWRQEEKDEPVFDPSVLPPNVTSVPGIPNVTNVPGIPNITNVPGIPNVTSVPGLPNVTNVPGIPNVTNVPRNFEYPPPNYNKDYNNYLQQGDGHYIQNQYYNEEDLAELSLSERNLPNQNTERFDCEIAERATIADFENDRNVEKIDNELQKNAKRPVENWRNSKDEKWTRQKSRDNVSEDGDRRSVAKGPREPRSRVNRRNSGEEAPKSPSRRHVSDVPRNHKYWDHDDRCDKDY